MKRLLMTTVWLTGLVVCQVSHAIPLLQLDIAPGGYDTVYEDSFNTENQFTLYAYLSGDFDSQWFYISAALIPSTSVPVPGLGSFKFGDQTIKVTDEMFYGAPPLEQNLDWDTGDLQKHGVFETYYLQFAFQFDPTMFVSAFDTQTGEAADGTMYYKSFDVDVSGMPLGYGIHFDLYNVAGVTDIDVLKNAPFSHDATGYRVPDGGATAALLGLAMVGLGLIVRRKS